MKCLKMKCKKDAVAMMVMAVAQPDNAGTVACKAGPYCAAHALKEALHSFWKGTVAVVQVTA